MNDYDPVAREYAAATSGEIEAKPFDHAVLESFARLVVGSGGRGALDAGCGPGHAAGVIAGAGLTVEGVDLSPAMIAAAEERHPGTRLHVADMAALPHQDGFFDGVCAWYSIVHTPLAS